VVYAFEIFATNSIDFDIVMKAKNNSIVFYNLR